MTLVNHEPGPSTTHSASSTASTASGHAFGSGGSSRMPVMRPPVVATADWPVTTIGPSGPSTSAAISIACVDMGSTRPRACRSRPTQSSPATGSSSSCHSATISRFPTACRSSSPSVEKRCCMTSRHVLPHSPSSHRADNAIRRSPGGSTPELATQPSARPAVVGDRDHGRQPVRQVAQRREGRVQPVPAAERDDTAPTHSRPRSRWTAVARTPASCIRLVISSVIATERCLPPVQPTDTVTYERFSRS